jgi:hypothetical protein
MLKKMKRYFIPTLLFAVCLLLLQSCGSRKSCNTREKNRTEMGWM